MKIQLVWDIPRVNGAETLRSGERFEVLQQEEIGPLIDNKPGFCSILVDNKPFIIYSQEYDYARYFSVWFLTALILLTIIAQSL